MPLLNLNFSTRYEKGKNSKFKKSIITNMIIIIEMQLILTNSYISRNKNISIPNKSIRKCPCNRMSNIYGQHCRLTRNNDILSFTSVFKCYTSKYNANLINFTTRVFFRTYFDASKGIDGNFEV